MAKMKFEKASPADKAEILALYRSLAGTEFCAWTSDYPGAAEIEDDLSREALFCLKAADEKIIGVISIDHDEAVEKLPCWMGTPETSAELSRLGVQTEYQNQGIARKLLEYGMEELRRQGKSSVHFLVCKTNRKAIRSYDRLNFNVVGECELFDEEWWCYEKSLIPAGGSTDGGSKLLEECESKLSEGCESKLSEGCGSKLLEECESKLSAGSIAQVKEKVV